VLEGALQKNNRTSSRFLAKTVTISGSASGTSVVGYARQNREFNPRKTGEIDQIRHHLLFGQRARRIQFEDLGQQQRFRLRHQCRSRGIARRRDDIAEVDGEYHPIVP